MIYLDTSVLVAYYCPETLSELIQDRIRGANRPALSSLAEVEFSAALARKLRRQEIEVQASLEIQTLLRKHLQMGLYLRLDLAPRHFEAARVWLDSLRAPLRTLDALHLALAVDAGLPLITADRQLATAAKTFGFEAELLS